MPDISELIAEMEAGLEGVTPGPWQVISEIHPWKLPARPEWGRLDAKNGLHTERRIYTAQHHPQLKGPYPIVEIGFGITTEPGKSVPMLSIIEENATHIARCSPDNIAAIIAGYREMEALLREALAALEPIAKCCDEAVRPDDSDRDGVTVKTVHLRRARSIHDKIKKELSDGEWR